MKVSRSQPGGEQYLALQALARQTGQGFEQLSVLYALEGFLRRLASSDDRESFVLKGGVLLAAFDARRPTRDADFLALDLNNDRMIIETKIASIANIDAADGLVLDISSVSSQVIRDEDEYSGIRVKLTYVLATMKLRVGIDINVGDPVYPAPRLTTVPGLLTRDVTVLGYPMAAVVAEKAVTAMQRGVANTRWRDWADILTLARRYSFASHELAQAITSVADHRGAEITLVAALLPSYPEIAQGKWAAWQRRPDVIEGLPESFTHVLIEVSQFIDPVIDGLAPDAVWNPIEAEWETRQA